MANSPEEKVEFATVVRVLEYVGPKAWIEATLARGAVPLQGERVFSMANGEPIAKVTSGMVQWVEQPVKEVKPGAGITGAPLVPPPSDNRGN